MNNLRCTLARGTGGLAKLPERFGRITTHYTPLCQSVWFAC